MSRDERSTETQSKPSDPRSEVERQSSVKAALELYRYIRPYSRWFWPAMIAVFVTSGLALVFPYMMGNLIGGSLEKGFDRELLHQEMNRTAVILLSVLALQAFVAFWRIRWFANAVERAIADVRRDTFSRLIRLPMAFFGERRVGELTSRLASDLETIRDTFAMTVPQFIRQAIIFLVGVCFIFVTSVKLTLFMLGTLPVIILAVAIVGRRIRGLSRKSQDELAASNVVVEETLQGIADVKAFSNEQFETNRYRNAMEAFVQTALRTASARALFVSFIIFALMGSIVVVVWFGAGMVRDGTLDSREFAKFVFFSIFIGTALGSFPEIMSQVQKTVGAADRVREILRDEPEETQSEDTTRGRLKGALELRNVYFSYPSRNDIGVLSDVSFKAAQGERVALVGPSGAGKSTIINLLLRFYDPAGGTILFDDVPAVEYPLSYLRSQMAIVPQEVILFGGSIRDNIAYGKIGATKEEIIDAARRANAHEFIESFPEGYETAAGERGVKLSGGQRQRIAIARAILADPAILILDEATSSLDSESERLVQEALEGLMQDRTSVIIAHRLATIRNCDRIVVLHDGKVVETGSHEELVENTDGLYRMLAELQFQ